MNGQPTAQNTRETGCNGDLPGFRNWQNEEHVAELARLWNVEPDQIPHWGAADARDADLPLRRAGLDRVPLDHRHQPGGLAARAAADPRRSSRRSGLFLVVSGRVPDRDGASSPTSSCPAALWGEKTGTFTNADRTVHLSEQAVEPPGEARPDLEIFLDYARRLDFRDKDGAAARQVVDAGGVLRGLEGVHARPALRLHRPELRQAARRQRHPVALQRRRRPTAPSGSTPTCTFPTAARRSARTTATTSSPARRSREAEYRALGARRPRDPQGGRVDAAARVGAATSTRSRSRPAAPSTTSTPARRPAARPSCRPPRPTPGSSSARPTPSGSASPRATWCASPRRAASIEVPARIGGAARGRRLRPLPLRLLGRRRRRRPRRPAARRERADDHDLGPGLQAAAASRPPP